MMSQSAPKTSIPGLRIDRWLVFARFCRSRELAETMVSRSRIRLNGRVVEKPHTLVRPGDILTLPLKSAPIVVRILALPARRGPAPEARAGYELLPPQGMND